jgi:hypothetical protein
MANDRQQELEALAQVEAAEWDNALTTFIAKAEAEGATVLQAEEVWGQELASGGFGSVGAWPDAAGNVVRWMTLTNPNEHATQAVSYAQYMAPDGMKELIVLNAADRKADSTHIIQLGTQFHVYTSGHTMVSNPRYNSLDLAVWDAGAVPYGPGEKPKTGVSDSSDNEQIFADVPEGSTFYPHIQALASRGIIGGYPCGGPGEPCDAESRPYFRVGNSVTRGQFAKMLSLAMGWVGG